MGKVVKTIGKVAGFVGLAVATVATAGGFAMGSIGHVVLGIGKKAAINIATGLTIGGGVLSAIGGAATKGPQLEDSGANARNQTGADPNAMGAFVFGETAMPMTIVFEQAHNDNTRLTTVFAGDFDPAQPGTAL